MRQTKFKDSWEIYTLSDPRDNAVRYVGVTVLGVRERFMAHLRYAKNGEGTHKYYWIRGLLNAGMEPVCAVIDTGHGMSWVDAERRWIEHYKSLGCKLTNHTVGGEGAPGNVQTEEEKAKRSAKMRGRKLTPEHKAKLSAAKKGRKLSPEHIEKYASKLRGRKRPPGLMEKLRLANLGKKRSPEAVARMTEANRRPKSQETLRRMALAHKGKRLTVEQRRKISLANKGRKPTDEARRKLSESVKEQHRRQRRRIERFVEVTRFLLCAAIYTIPSKREARTIQVAA